MILFKKKLTEQEVIDGCVNGSKGAQKALYETYSSKMFAVCCRYITDKDDARDIHQEAFIKIFDNIKLFKNIGSFEGWIKRIVINTTLSHLSKQQKSNIIPLEDGLADELSEEENDSTEGLTFELSKEQLYSLLQTMSEDNRLVFNLAIFENYSHKEIAETLKISETYSRVRLNRAREFLKKKILILQEAHSLTLER